MKNSRTVGISIPLTRPYFDGDEIEQVRQVLDSGWVAQGPKVKEFEEKSAQRLGARHAVSVANCTAALHLSLLALGIKEDDEVLVADYTFPATGHAVLFCKAKPVFVDIDPKTYTIDPNLIEEKITPKTRAIIPVHIFGQPADMDAIMQIAQRHGLKVVEDAACAFGARYKDRFAGTIGDIGCFSFHARKGITTGEGGMVVTGDGELAEKIRRLSVFGMVSAWKREGTVVSPEFVDLGYNYKLSDITAAVGVAQLQKLDRFIAWRRSLAEYWDDKLKKMDLIEPPYVDKDALHIYQSYVALVDERVERNQLMQRLLEQGIQTQIGTYASHIQPVYNSGQKCPKSLDVFNRSLALPLYYALKEEEIDFAAIRLEKALKECLRR